MPVQVPLEIKKNIVNQHLWYPPIDNSESKHSFSSFYTALDAIWLILGNCPRGKLPTHKSMMQPNLASYLHKGQILGTRKEKRTKPLHSHLKSFDNPLPYSKNAKLSTASAEHHMGDDGLWFPNRVSHFAVNLSNTFISIAAPHCLMLFFLFALIKKQNKKQKQKQTQKKTEKVLLK